MDYVPHTPTLIVEEHGSRKESGSNYFDYIAENDLFEIDPDRLELRQPIGSGSFGEVHFGLLDGTKEVAIKTAKMATEWTTVEQRENQAKQRESMRSELKVFANIGVHENVVQLLGAVTKNQKEFCIVLEYCENRGLDTFLKERKEMFINEIVQPMTTTTATQYKAEVESNWTNDFVERRLADYLTTSDLLAFGVQASRGLEFLHNKKILHRDLALRNMLLTQDFIVKIADFGLSRSTEDDKYFNYNNSKLPFRWLPLEALLSASTPLKSDYWTFGVLLWELFSFNAEPYQGMNPIQYISFIEKGNRLDKPTYAPMESINRGQKQSKYSIQEFEPNSPTWHPNQLQSPGRDAGRKSSRDSESIEMSPLFVEQRSLFDTDPVEETTNFISTNDNLMLPAIRRECSFASNHEEIRLPTVLEKRHQTSACCTCTLRRIVLAVAIFLLITMATTAIGIFSYRHIRNENFDTTTVSACAGNNMRSLSKAKVENILDKFTRSSDFKHRYGYGFNKHEYPQFVQFGTVEFIPASDDKSFTATCQCSGQGVVCYLDMSSDDRKLLIREFREYRALNKGSGRYDLITSGSITCTDNGQYFLNESQWVNNVSIYACYTTTWAGSAENRNTSVEIRSPPEEVFYGINTTSMNWNGSEYLVVQKEELWEKADYKCTLWGGNLVDIKNRAEYDLVYSLMKYDYAKYWIGLKQFNGDLRWRDGSHPSYTSWPSHYIGTHNKHNSNLCVYMKKDPKNYPKATWYTVECDNTDTLKEYICKRIHLNAFVSSLDEDEKIVEEAEE